MIGSVLGHLFSFLDKADGFVFDFSSVFSLIELNRFRKLNRFRNSLVCVLFL